MHIVPAQFSRWIGRAGNCGGSVPPRGWKSHMFQPNRAKRKTGTLCKRIPRSCQGRMGGRAGSFCCLFVRFWTPSGQTSLQCQPGSKQKCNYNRRASRCRVTPNAQLTGQRPRAQRRYTCLRVGNLVSGPAFGRSLAEKALKSADRPEEGRPLRLPE